MVVTVRYLQAGDSNTISRPSTRVLYKYDHQQRLFDPNLRGRKQHSFTRNSAQTTLCRIVAEKLRINHCNQLHGSSCIRAALWWPPASQIPRNAAPWKPSWYPYDANQSKQRKATYIVLPHCRYIFILYCHDAYEMSVTYHRCTYGIFSQTLVYIHLLYMYIE